MAQRQIRENIQGKRDYEMHVHDQIQTVMKNYEQLELHAENMKHEHEHQRYMSAIAEAQRQQEHIQTWERITEQTEAQIRHRR